MDSATPARELAEPHLGEVLSTAGLDIEYVRAEGNTLYYRNDKGEEVPVIDFCGGYASLIFGHSNPEIFAHVKSILDAQIPIYAQFSRQPRTHEIAAILNKIIKREFETEEDYIALFASTGAEAIEIAAKHAEFDRMLKISTLKGEVDSHIEHARSLLRSGKATVPDDIYKSYGTGEASTELDKFEEVVSEILRRNAEQSARPPLFLALEGAFHGKLIGSVQFTYNAGFRTPFKAMAAQAKFVPFDQPDALAKIVSEEQAHLIDVSVSEGVIQLVKRNIPVFCAFFIEPIQGEGGIHPVSQEFAAEIRRICDEIDCPIVIDEIQTGMGRTGSFFASSAIGLRGDYYALSKSLGGGVAKCSVMLVREGRYRKDFELIHSSTFGKDGFSCSVALKVLQMLEADDGRMYRQVQERGGALKAMLERVKADFPDVVKDVRGRGLLLGLEFHDQSNAKSTLIRDFARAGVFGYIIAGYLLRNCGIRALPTASAVNNLRFAPSAYVSDAEISQLETGLREVCTVLRDQDEQRFFS